ncbi:MAG: FHA domain-containing protein [Myxococcota bacterium]
MDRHPVLVAIKGPMQGARYPFPVDGVTIGRDETCTVVIEDSNVSRFHARLVLHNAAVWVQDAGSRNGVFVNEKRVVRHKQFGPGDELVLGEHTFTLEMEALPTEVSLTGSMIAEPEAPQQKMWILAVYAALAVLIQIPAASMQADIRLTITALSLCGGALIFWLVKR